MVVYKVVVYKVVEMVLEKVEVFEVEVVGWVMDLAVMVTLLEEVKVSQVLNYL